MINFFIIILIFVVIYLILIPNRNVDNSADTDDFSSISETNSSDSRVEI